MTKLNYETLDEKFFELVQYDKVTGIEEIAPETQLELLGELIKTNPWIIDECDPLIEAKDATELGALLMEPENKEAQENFLMPILKEIWIKAKYFLSEALQHYIDELILQEEYLVPLDDGMEEFLDGRSRARDMMDTMPVKL